MVKEVKAALKNRKFVCTLENGMIAVEPLDNKEAVATFVEEELLVVTQDEENLAARWNRLITSTRRLCFCSVFSVFCLIVNRITQKVIDRFSQNVLERLASGLETIDYILGTIQIFDEETQRQTVG